MKSKLTSVRLAPSMWLALVVVITTITACNKQNDLQPTNDKANLESVTFTIASDDVQTRAGSSIKRYIMEVYTDNEGTLTPVNCFGATLNTNREVKAAGSFIVNLDKVTDYTILFWADNGAVTDSETQGTYNASDLEAVALNANQAMTETAYFAKVEGKVTAAQDVSLNRAVAKISFVQKGDYINNVAQTITVTYDNRCTFNCLTSVATPLATVKERVFTLTNVVITDEAVLGADYVFASATSANTLINLTLAMASENVANNQAITNIPTNANKVTELVGQYSGQLQTSTFTILTPAGWDTPETEHPFPKASE